MKYYFTNGKEDVVTTWINNSKWSWIIPVVCILISGFLNQKGDQNGTTS